MSKRTHAPVRTGDVVEVTVDRLAHGGRGVARHEGFVLFVSRGLPGDRVRARVTRVKKSFAEATAEAVLEPGPDSVEPGCHPECGACSWQRLAYPAQLRLKEELVRDAIVRLGGVEEPPLEPIIGAEQITGYRNKVEYTFDQDPETGEVSSGYHRPGRWDEIVAIDSCQLADPRTAAAKRIVDAWANRHGLQVYDRDSAAGLLRTLVLRVGYVTGELQVHLVTGPTAKGKGLFKAAELVDDLEAGVPGLVGVLHSQTDSVADVSFSDEAPTVLWGRDWFLEEMGGKQLKVRSKSFTQTNTQMANRLYERVVEIAQLRPDDVAYDLYCGLGSITLTIAPHVETVVGVEVVDEAIECAKENAELNGVENIEWQVGNVRPILKFAKGVWPDPTLVVVDPPRAGLVPKVVRRICEARPERIVYVSCNPTTFAGNLPMFREHGYELVLAQPVDQFPHTSHCELVARLEPIEGWTPPAEEDIVYGRAKPDNRPRRADVAAALGTPDESEA